MNDSNLNTYNSYEVINWYKNLGGITQVEKYFFESNKDLLPKASVLDIGIGGGRTTDYLIDKCANYTGIDYSQGFVDVVKKKYPKADILNADARNLLNFEAKKFDIVNFSFKWN